MDGQKVRPSTGVGAGASTSWREAYQRARPGLVRDERAGDNGDHSASAADDQVAAAPADVEASRLSVA
ncbi:hypothetical protein [Streptomyces sp. NBC_00467]|uniref:hypothetical protein n=1 Tax=Streptomyces sp. NBC_00467 TaxID=2975752 RepID=UPI002E17D42E